MSSLVGEPSSARRARREASRLNAIQKKKEDLRLAEKDSIIAKKKSAALSGKGGRQSLIKSSPTGLATNLGGTTA